MRTETCSKTGHRIMLRTMAVTKYTQRSQWFVFWGLILFVCAVLLLFALLSYTPDDIAWLRYPPNTPARNLIGWLGAHAAFLCFLLFGVLGYLVPALLLAMGLWMVLLKEGLLWPKAVYLALILCLSCVIVHGHDPHWEQLSEKLALTSVGGEVGYVLGEGIFVKLLGPFGALLLAYALVAGLLVLLTGVHPLALAAQIGAWSKAIYARWDRYWAARRDRQEQIEREQRELAKRRKRLEELMAAEQQAAEAREPATRPAVRPAVMPPPKVEPLASAVGVSPKPATQPTPAQAESKAPSVTEALEKTREPTLAQGARTAAAAGGEFRLPPLDLLDPLPPESEREIHEDLKTSANVLKETLAEFGVEVDITNVERGPVVTRYELLPAPGVRVEKIVQLSNNIALAMKAESVRIQAPIPGKGVVGIEVPNPKTKMVYLREIVESDVWQNTRAALPLALGKDVSGRVIVADLAEMPHLLIAGATGSGKTVCMNSIIAGLLMCRTPQQMRLMLIDPKIVEFSVYSSLPHLVVPVITDPKKVAIGLRWAITEMEKRYRLFAKVGVRNIQGYNSRPIARQAELFKDIPSAEEPEDKPPDRLPYIVIVVDELADLMLVAQADIENAIARLAQLSRAVGIHMILATQRPSVNVITGTIKANFPARISFQVAQKVDSRTILDANGADKLLGKGDMLFLPPGTSKLVRAQATYTSDAELRRIVDFLKAQGEPEYELEVKDRIERSSVELPEQEEDEEVIKTAIEVIRQTRRASASVLQRRMRIGYTRAARLIDILEERGIVGPPRGSDPREILIDLDGEIPQNRLNADQG